MKEQIQKILGMAKAGTITDEQAVELIAALGEQTAADRRSAEHGRPPNFGQRFGMFERVIDAMSGGRTSDVRGVYPSDMNGNDFSMSEVEAIEGATLMFRDNHVRMSHLKDITLTRSQMIGNDIGSSKVQDIVARDSSIASCIIHGSSLTDLKLEDSHMEKVQMRASKFSDARLQQSRVDELVVTASHVKNVGLHDGSLWERSRVEATHLNNLETSASTIVDVGFDMSRLTNVDVKRSVLRVSMVRGYKWADVKVVDCVFEDVMFGAGEANRKCVLKDVTLENCKVEKAIFADTTMVGTTIRNVALSGVKVMGVHLRDRVIDGNEQFIEAIGGAEALKKYTPEA